MLRKLLAILLLGEALRNALWLTALLPSMVWRDFETVVLVAVRAAVSAVEIVGGVLLLENRQRGAALARIALPVSAVLVTLEIGWRLSPSDVDPTFRWWIVAGYWLYAIAASVWLRRSGTGLDET